MSQSFLFLRKRRKRQFSLQNPIIFRNCILTVSLCYRIEIIVDDPSHDYFDHHHHHPHPPLRPQFLPLPLPPPPQTTPLPPLPPPEEEPEEPEEQPRVKKYSYFYLSRSLWYIPLYFTVWFTFYVTWLILQSIGRHKVNWSGIIIQSWNLFNFPLILCNDTGRFAKSYDESPKHQRFIAQRNRRQSQYSNRICNVTNWRF